MISIVLSSNTISFRLCDIYVIGKVTNYYIVPVDPNGKSTAKENINRYLNKNNYNSLN